MSDARKFAVILPAAGMSRRFATAGGKSSKLEAVVGGKPVIVRSVELFANRGDVTEVIVAVEPDSLDAFRFKWSDKLSFLGAKIVAGGKLERWETVANALRGVESDATHIAVHDAARPVADAGMIDRVFAAAEVFDAVIPAVPVHATLKRLAGEPSDTADKADPLDAILGSAGKKTVEAFDVLETVPRNGLYLVQTPQVFRRELLARAYAGVAAGKVDARAITDDAGLVEAMGERVVAVMGDAMNVKITLPEDVAFAEAVAMMRSGAPAKDLLGSKRKHPTWAQMDDD